MSPRVVIVDDSLTVRMDLAEAFEAALTADPDFDLATALQALFAEGLVVDVAVAPAEKESK